ncbi:GNAT family N-acetyltransferase [Brevibacillus sp. SIMBA_040]|uniref:GNAT family N-acetyltransferase n=1 Tax=unclassified Brevibacillus TaxID=2684853 RepID=UPI00397AFD22
MSILKIVTFSTGRLTEAGRLLALCQKRANAAIPALLSQGETEKLAIRVLAGEWEKTGVSGAAALEGDKLVGYVIGQKQENAMRGRHVWISLVGQAIALEQPVELYRDLYAAAAQEWVDEGYFYHCAMVPAGNPDLLQTWFCLGFGHEQVHGLLSLKQFQPSASSLRVDGVELRLATPEDREAFADVSPLIRTYQAKSPVFGVALPEDAHKIRDGYSGLVDDPQVDLWIAKKGGEIISFQAYFPADPDPITMTPEHCIELGVAGTQPEYRGSGINFALTTRGLAHAKEKGYHYCITDWRMTNLQSSRYWPRQGFVPIVYRLSRLIDHRIAWAKG